MRIRMCLEAANKDQKERIQIRPHPEASTVLWSRSCLLEL